MKSLWKKWYVVEDENLKKNIAGLIINNPVGLAAGFDKDAKLFDELAYCGFGFIEIGTITPLPQEGNPKKRLFRLKKDNAIINRMGFNNQGLEAAIKRLKKRKNKNLIVGGNIGKNKVTPNENAAEDYLKCFAGLFPYVDYFVVNVSSPNTPDLRSLQDKEPLTLLLNQLMTSNQKESDPKPIFLKIAPDLNESQLNDIIEIVFETNISGIIATNTTISRDNLTTPKHEVDQIGAGGLSGKPLSNRSTEVIAYLRSQANMKFPNKELYIIGVGGIHSASDAIEKLNAGADLVQLYTGFIYEGPSLVKRINKTILEGKQKIVAQ
jgi:dihydroorotate dehydrogenase